MEIPGDELRKLPWVKRIPNDGRLVSLRSYFDGSLAEWHFYHSVGGIELGRIAGGEVITGSYFAAAPANPATDFEFPLSTLITMRLSFPEMLRVLDFIENDIHRCAAVLEKFHTFSPETSSGGLRGALLVTSEFEYLLYLLRSLYDLFQRAVMNFAKRLVLIEGDQKRHLKELPDSFAKVALDGEEVRAVEGIQEKWGLPVGLAEWYSGEASFFKELRKVRDAVAHQGRSTPTVFSTPWGFAISPEEHPWNRFEFWPTEQRWDGRLGAFRAMFAQFVARGLGASSRFAAAVAASVQLPESISDDLRVYIRSPLAQRIIGLPAMLAQPWEIRDGES